MHTQHVKSSVYAWGGGVGGVGAVETVVVVVVGLEDVGGGVFEVVVVGGIGLCVVLDDRVLTHVFCGECVWCLDDRVLTHVFCGECVEMCFLFFFFESAPFNF